MLFMPCTCICLLGCGLVGSCLWDVYSLCFS
jgi:hypothetical protein